MTRNELRVALDRIDADIAFCEDCHDHAPRIYRAMQPDVDALHQERDTLVLLLREQEYHEYGGVTYSGMMGRI